MAFCEDIQFDKRIKNEKREKRFVINFSLAYNSICAYSACWIPTDYTVDHFLPRTHYPRLAYEWDNNRLSCARINQKKGDKIGILDPFSIKPGWFVLDCASFYVHPGEALQMALVGQIRYTIDTLDLNCDSLVEMRFNVTRDYSQGNINLVFLQSRYPFVGLELRRQNLVRTIIGAIK